jgi:translocon-associated protein subunit delta
LCTCFILQIFNPFFQVQRSKEDTATVKPLFTIDVNHQGAWKGPIVQSEFLAAAIAMFVWYLAFSAKSKLQL